MQVPNVGRTPDLIAQGLNGTLQANMSANYNLQLATSLKTFVKNSTQLGIDVNINIHPTRELFDFTLDSADVLGFENVTAGWWTGLGAEEELVSLATYYWWNK